MSLGFISDQDRQVTCCLWVKGLEECDSLGYVGGRCLDDSTPFGTHPLSFESVNNQGQVLAKDVDSVLLYLGHQWIVVGVHLKPR